MTNPQKPEMPIWIDMAEPDPTWKDDLDLILPMVVAALGLIGVGFVLGRMF